MLACVAATPVAGLADSPQPLPVLNVNIGETSVSGLSSGGFMAVQFQIAHSSIVKGAGIVAGGPYFCAQNSVITATTLCSCTTGLGDVNADLKLTHFSCLPPI
jgi:poly(3-hydroxybutyrate) depolymerase